MRSIVLALAYMASLVHARTVRTALLQLLVEHMAEQMRATGDFSNKRAFAMLLRAPNPKSAFALWGRGARSATSNRPDGVRVSTIPKAPMNPEASFTEDLGADSLGEVELMMAIQDAFGIDIPDEEAEKMTSPAEYVADIKAKRNLRMSSNPKAPMTLGVNGLGRTGSKRSTEVFMNSAEDVEEKLNSIIAEQLSVDLDKVKPEASFTEDLGADSLDAVELIMAIEEAFGIEIPDEEAEKMTTPADCATAIKAKL